MVTRLQRLCQENHVFLCCWSKKRRRCDTRVRIRQRRNFLPRATCARSVARRTGSWSGNSSDSTCTRSTVSPTGQRKHCIEDVPEETEGRAQVLVLGSPSIITPVIHLSREAHAIVVAINGALALRLDGIQRQMRVLVGQMKHLKKEVTQLGAQVQYPDQRMNDVERKLQEVAVGTVLPHRNPEPAKKKKKHNTHRNNIVQCWWWDNPKTTQREDEICEKLRAIFRAGTRCETMLGSWTVGSVVTSNSNMDVWAFF